jgi:hypothetical protein
MKTAVFSVMGVSDQSMVAGVRIARWLADLTGGVLCCSEEDTPDEKFDLLFLVLGPETLCKGNAQRQRLVRDSGRVVLVQNDYTIRPQPWSTMADSYARNGYRERREARVPNWQWHVWTTCSKVREKFHPLGKMVNWNALCYEPLPEARRAELRARATPGVLYYGAFRQGRVSRFDKYFRQPPAPVTVSAPRAAMKKFTEAYPDVRVEPAVLDREAFLPYLAEYAVGLYMEDEQSSKDFHSPACRFYEMLSAGQAILFQPGCRDMLDRAGFDVREWVGGPERIPEFVDWAEEIAAAQRERFCQVDYRAKLTVQVTDLIEQLDK